MKEFELSKTYNAKEKEGEIYKLWEKSGFFNPDKLPGKRKKPFIIIMPPPNANGSLHIGHALFVSLQDIMTRYNRMKGSKALWLPGADHAGFETQVVFDKKLEKQGRSRFKIPRKKLYKEILEFTMQNKKIMQNQLKSLGASCDWSREKFTLDPKIIKIVYQTFNKLKKDGLLYQGDRIINWCVKHQTSLSDLEIKYQERQDPLYYIKYGPFVLATVRPETKFGDTAVAVNPKDKRYKKYIGKTITAKGLVKDFKLKVIADEKVDPDFGTGVIKVTPAHDPADFEIGQRHKLAVKPVIDFYGRLNKKTGHYAGLKVKQAREKIALDLEKAGLMKKVEHNYKHKVALCYKCGNVIEPLVLPNQWFVKMTVPPKNKKMSLRDMAVNAVKKKQIQFIPKRFEKIFFHWMNNLKDWNISRQIVWGIKIPDKKTNDVFDTWFSSGQWPFASLMANKAGDFKNFYPTDVMETGSDILFFWVSRMIMLGLYATGKIPFKYVYLHGLVRDKARAKMSKSKGNVIDPLGVIALYGADALRMALITNNSPGTDPIISEEKIRGYRNFINKVWNGARFILQQTSNEKRKMKNEKLQSKIKNLTKNEKWILKELEQANKKATKHIEEFRFDLAAETLYHFFWHTFCDKYIEEAKNEKRKMKNEREKKKIDEILLYVLLTSLKLLHPFAPFVTEEIYQKLPLKNRKKCLMIEDWPD